MITDILLGATIAFILISTSLIQAQLNDIRQHLERIDAAQRAIADELDITDEPRDEAA